jgi:hypothetical protein
MDGPEMIDISSFDLNESGSSRKQGLKSSNFGGGIELLMNDKVKEGSGSKLSSDIDIDDLGQVLYNICLTQGWHPTLLKSIFKKNVTNGES